MSCHRGVAVANRVGVKRVVPRGGVPRGGLEHTLPWVHVPGRGREDS